MLKKINSSVIALFLFFTYSPLTWGENVHLYQDVSEESVYFSAVDYLRRNDVFMNTPHFYPEKIISRAEFIKYLVVLNNPRFIRIPAELPFEDTQNDAWYAPYFKEAIDLGILDERELYAEPYKQLTMHDALALLFHSQSIPIPNVYRDEIPYTDIKPDSFNAALFMRAIALKIVEPMRADYFGMYRRVTRGQAANMIYRLDLAANGLNAINNSASANPDYAPELQKIINVWQLVETNFIYEENIDKAAMSDAALEAMVEALGDKYSSYMDQQKTSAFFGSIEGNVEGIGAVLGYNEAKEVIIMSLIPDSPAEKIGLLSKDVIAEVEGQDVLGKTIEEIVPLIKGPKGTTVKLKIRRGVNFLEYTIQRELINIKALDYDIIDNGSIYHIKLSQFGATADQELIQVLNVFKNDPQAKGLILDLRNNPGGLLDVTVDFLGHFIEAEKELVHVNYKDYSQVLLSHGDAEMKDVPMTVLINGLSASASEIVAGALKDYKLATLVGETTFGKGSVQSLKMMTDQSSLKLTVARWLTPNGFNINEEGVSPDVLASDNIETSEDEALSVAITEVKKRMNP